MLEYNRWSVAEWRFGGYYGAIIASSIGYCISIYISLHFIQKEDGFKLNYKSTFIMALKTLVPAISMVIVLLFINQYLPFDVYNRKEGLILVIIDTIVGGIIYLGLSFKMKIPQKVFGEDYINRAIKKLTFGKFPKN